MEGNPGLTQTSCLPPPFLVNPALRSRRSTSRLVMFLHLEKWFYLHINVFIWRGKQNCGRLCIIAPNARGSCPGR